MADRRNDRSNPEAPEGDPLTELARLIGQADPNASLGRANTRPVPQYADAAPNEPAPSRPSWMQHHAPQAESEYEPHQAAHPLRRHAAPAADGSHDADYADDQQSHDAYYEGADRAAGDYGYETSDQYDYDDDGYAQDDPAVPNDRQKRRKTLMTVGAVLALGVLGTGGALAYRTYVGNARPSEPPVIKADTAPIKVVPPTSASDMPSKPIQDRMAAAGGEQMVSREEQPVDVRDPTKAGARSPFPPVSPTTSASPAAGLTAPKASPDEPRRIRTFAVKGDASDVAASPAAKPAPRLPGAKQTAPAGGAPMTLTPAPAADANTRIANVSAVPNPATASGGYVVQISSQKTEADAQASYKALQSKFPDVLGSRSPLIKRADLGDKGVYYRAMVGPFASSDEASQVCNNLKVAGGQCVVQRN